MSEACWEADVGRAYVCELDRSGWLGVVGGLVAVEAARWGRSLEGGEL